VSSYFISYRRQDAGGHAGRLMDRLASRFGGDRVFMDVQDIRPGQNFSTSIEETLARCTHVLAVVGPRWLDILKQRAAAGEDLVRHEISVGLTRGLTVIPVLVGGAQMPSTDDLPPEMAGFARCQAMEIRDNRFDDDCADLVAFLGGATPDASAGASRRTIVAAGLAAAVVLIAGAVYFFTKAPSQPAPEPFSLTGDWIGQFQKPGQPAYRVRLRLAQTGKMLAGSVIYPTGEGPIVESRIEDDGTFTFATSHTPQFESEPATIRFQGQVIDGRLQLVSTDSNGMATGTASRAEAAAASERGLPRLSLGTWTLRGAVDEGGKNWSDSVLQFTAQEETAEGLTLRGTFTWRLDAQLVGTEEVEGHYVERTREVFLEGLSIQNAAPGSEARLAIGSYSAVLAPDGRALVDGRWGSTARNEPGVAGRWEAVR
jgi:hypothetical protein